MLSFLKRATLTLGVLIAILVGGVTPQAMAAPSTGSVTRTVAASTVISSPVVPSKKPAGIWATYGWYADEYACAFAGSGMVNTGQIGTYTCTNEGLSGPNQWRLDVFYD